MRDASPHGKSVVRRAGRLVLTALFACLFSAPWLAAGDPASDSRVLQTSSSELSVSEIQMWRLINHDRADIAAAEETRGNARSLAWDDRLAAVARQHSEEMARNGYFSHQGLDGSLPYTRVSRAGIQWRATGENIAKFPDVQSAQAGFMDEPRFQHNHRGNILNPAYTHVGVGIARGADGLLYITQEFATLP
jgi:uncharacterized protein YkwD